MRPDPRRAPPTDNRTINVYANAPYARLRANGAAEGRAPVAVGYYGAARGVPERRASQSRGGELDHGPRPASGLTSATMARAWPWRDGAIFIFSCALA
jgi:hypothetical protein